MTYTGYGTCGKCGKRLTLHKNGRLNRHYGQDHEPCDGEPGRGPVSLEKGSVGPSLAQAVLSRQQWVACHPTEATDPTAYAKWLRSQEARNG